MTFATLLSILISTTASFAAPADCADELLGVVRGLRPADRRSVARATDDFRDFKRAEILFSFPSQGGSLDRLTLASLADDFPALELPATERVLVDGRRWFVARGPSRLLGAFATKLGENLPSSDPDYVVLEATVAALGRPHARPDGKPHEVDATRGDLPAALPRTEGEDDGWSVTEVRSGLTFHVFRRQTLAPFLNTPKLLEATGLHVFEVPVHVDLADNLARFGKHLDRPVAVAVRHREVYLVNARAVETLRRMAARAADRHAAFVPNSATVGGASLVAPAPPPEPEAEPPLVRREFGDAGVIRALARIANHHDRLEGDPKARASEMAEPEGRARARLAALFADHRALEREIATNLEAHAHEIDPEMRRLMRDEHERLETALAEAYADLRARLATEADEETREIHLEIGSDENGHGDDLDALLEMYQNLAVLREWSVDVVETRSGKMGTRRARVRLEGRGVGALLDTEAGLHRFQLRDPKSGKVYTRFLNVTVEADGERRFVSADGRFARAYDLKSSTVTIDEMRSGEGLDRILSERHAERVRRRVDRLAAVRPDTP